MYYVSEKQRPLIGLGKTIVAGIRYSIIRMDDIDVLTKSKTFLITDIVSRNLTKKELKVFAAWKRNAIKNPVPK